MKHRGIYATADEDQGASYVYRGAVYDGRLTLTAIVTDGLHHTLGREVHLDLTPEMLREMLRCAEECQARNLVPRGFHPPHPYEPVPGFEQNVYVIEPCGRCGQPKAHPIHDVRRARRR